MMNTQMDHIYKYSQATKAEKDYIAFNLIMYNIHMIEKWNDELLEIISNNRNRINWATLPINNITIILFAKYGMACKTLFKRRWLESDEWMHICNDNYNYDN